MSDADAFPSKDRSRPRIPADAAAALFFVVAAAALAALELNPLTGLFQRSDPTLQGSLTLLAIRPLLSVAGHAALILIGLHQLLAPRPAATSLRTQARVGYGLLAFELLLLAPCLFALDALCGVFYLGASPFTAMAMLIGFAVYLAKAHSRALTTAAISVSLVAAGAAIATSWIVTPGSHAECDRIEEPIPRDDCRMSFALAASDEALCGTVDFDSSRWSCLYQIAERKGNAALCDRIALPCRHTDPGPACDPDFYRNTCLLVVARRLQDPMLCDRMTPGELQGRCREQAR